MNELTANLADVPQAATKTSSPKPQPFFGRPTEPRFERQQLEPTAIFQALGGVAEKDNT